MVRRNTGGTMKYETRLIALDKISVTDQRLRYEPEEDSIIELASDIASKGLLQPVGVRRLQDGTFQLLWGGRRLAAHKRLGLASIWAHIYSDQDAPVKAIALVENLQRVNLSLQEECEAVAYLHEEEKKSPDQISSLLSKSRSWVLRRLALPNLPVELRGAVFDGRLSIGAAEEIARLEDDGARAYLANQAVQMGWSLDDVRTAVSTYQGSPSIKEAVEAAEAVRGIEGPKTESVAVCAACGKYAAYGALTNVWIHTGGCPPELTVIEGGKKDGS